ncbi:MAG: hypothetical protein JWO38_8262 [Gemmataceae bacterium]|nr:hypothetical protein [Gemmataceae bacterium]
MAVPRAVAALATDQWQGVAAARARGSSGRRLLAGFGRVWQSADRLSLGISTPWQGAAVSRAAGVCLAGRRQVDRVWQPAKVGPSVVLPCSAVPPDGPVGASPVQPRPAGGPADTTPSTIPVGLACRRWPGPGRGVTRLPGARPQIRNRELCHSRATVIPLSACRLFSYIAGGAPVAQLDRAFAFGAKGWGFESLRVYCLSSDRRSAYDCLGAVRSAVKTLDSAVVYRRRVSPCPDAPIPTYQLHKSSCRPSRKTGHA